MEKIICQNCGLSGFIKYDIEYGQNICNGCGCVVEENVYCVEDYTIGSIVSSSSEVGKIGGKFGSLKHTTKMQKCAEAYPYELKIRAKRKKIFETVSKLLNIPEYQGGIIFDLFSEFMEITKVRARIKFNAMMGIFYYYGKNELYFETCFRTPYEIATKFQEVMWSDKTVEKIKYKFTQKNVFDGIKIIKSMARRYEISKLNFIEIIPNCKTYIKRAIDYMMIYIKDSVDNTIDLIYKKYKEMKTNVRISKMPLIITIIYFNCRTYDIECDMEILCGIFNVRQKTVNSTIRIFSKNSSELII